MKNWVATLQRWAAAGDQDRRRTSRTPEPSIKVYYWDGSAPEGRKLRDISATGAYIVTAERWYPGTIVRLILQEFKAGTAEGERMHPSKSTTLLSRVVRHGPDGVGVEFVFSSPEQHAALRGFLSAIPQTRSPRKPEEIGEALLEFALVLPLLFLLIVNTANLAGFLFGWITVTNAARSGAQYMVRGASTFGAPAPAAASQITSLIATDIS